MLDKDEKLLMLNYGYAGQEPGIEILQLCPEEEPNRYEIQLYHHMATTIPINWQRCDVLEVSSGRGGGACYIKRFFQPISVIGIDFCQNAVDFCNHYYALDGLSFLHGNAETLDFPDESFDVVINIEASFYYPHVERFFNNVVRVLKPDGYFLYADMRYLEDLEAWRSQLRKLGLLLLSEEDITPNVNRALALVRKHRKKLIRQYVPDLLHDPFDRLWGITGGDLVNGRDGAGSRIYMGFVFQKKELNQ
jgi:SAM-dependent methyltransferase